MVKIIGRVLEQPTMIGRKTVLGLSGESRFAKVVNLTGGEVFGLVENAALSAVLMVSTRIEGFMGDLSGAFLLPQLNPAYDVAGVKSFGVNQPMAFASIKDEDVSGVSGSGKSDGTQSDLGKFTTAQSILDRLSVYNKRNMIATAITGVLGLASLALGFVFASLGAFTHAEEMTLFGLTGTLEIGASAGLGINALRLKSFINKIKSELAANHEVSVEELTEKLEQFQNANKKDVFTTAAFALSFLFVGFYGFNQTISYPKYFHNSIYMPISFFTMLAGFGGIGTIATTVVNAIRMRYLISEVKK